MPSRFLTEIPGDLLDEGSDGGWRPGASFTPSLAGRAETVWNGGGRVTASRGASFRLGEDVVHAAFGDGVVTAVEPDGVIVVRFAGDGSERKLMAEYAPVNRR
jgi:DNA helicase-2/ATP-dependent DNA helicase PcrA